MRTAGPHPVSNTQNSLHCIGLTNAYTMHYSAGLLMCLSSTMSILYVLCCTQRPNSAKASVHANPVKPFSVSTRVYEDSRVERQRPQRPHSAKPRTKARYGPLHVRCVPCRCEGGRGADGVWFSCANALPAGVAHTKECVACCLAALCSATAPSARQRPSTAPTRRPQRPASGRSRPSSGRPLFSRSTSARSLTGWQAPLQHRASSADRLHMYGAEASLAATQAAGFRDTSRRCAWGVRSKPTYLEAVITLQFVGRDLERYVSSHS